MTDKIMRLMSHPGRRAVRGYEAEITVSDDLTVLAEVSESNILGMDRLRFRFGEVIPGIILQGWRIEDALGDVVVDGDTIYFDGSLPSNGGCHNPPPTITIDDDENIWAYFWYASVSSPLLVARGLERILVSDAQKVLGDLGGRIGRTAEKKRLDLADSEAVKQAGFEITVYDDRILDMESAVLTEIRNAEDAAIEIAGKMQDQIDRVRQYLGTPEDRPYPSAPSKFDAEDLSSLMARIERGRTWLVEREEK